MRRYELSNDAYALIEPLLPVNKGKTGHPWNPHRPIINGILWRSHTGAPWEDIRECYGNWKTIYDRYVWWRRDGTWERILVALQVKLDAAGAIDWEQWSLDGTVVRAHHSAAGAPKGEGWDGCDEPDDHALGRSVGGFSTKIDIAGEPEIGANLTQLGGRDVETLIRVFLLGVCDQATQQGASD